jgi:hypothetical protein
MSKPHDRQRAVLQNHDLLETAASAKERASDPEFLSRQVKFHSSRTHSATPTHLHSLLALHSQQSSITWDCIHSASWDVKRDPTTRNLRVWALTKAKNSRLIPDCELC